MWDGRVQYNLHLYPLESRLELVSNMPGEPDTWPPFHIPALLVSREHVEAFIDAVYGSDENVRSWVVKAAVTEMLGVLRLCSYFHYDLLQTRCVEELANRLDSPTEVTPQLLAVWQFLAGIEHARLRTVALSATVLCLERNYAAVKSGLQGAGVWDSIDRSDMERMLEYLCSKGRRL